MSTGAKIALSASIFYAGSMVVFVHYNQHSERKVSRLMFALILVEKTSTNFSCGKLMVTQLSNQW